jgi:hypothetical protein
MPLFRSKQDRDYIKALNKELIERVVGEKITYYPISKKLSNVNLYGESLDKTFDTPVQIYAMIEWQDQNVTTTQFGPDIIYNLKVYILEDHLTEIDLRPKEGDMIDYNDVKFEIHQIQNPNLLFGKTHDSFNIVLNCKSIRKNSFDSSVSASVDLHSRTRPDNNNLSSSFAYTGILFAYTGSAEIL